MTDDYDVGYGKPPMNTRFRPGQSGNPKGRPRGTRNLSTDLKDELKTRVTVREGGQEKKVSKQRAMLMGMLAKAMGGDVKAAGTIIDLILRLHEQNEESRKAEPLSSEEQEVLLLLSKRLGGKEPETSGDDKDKGDGS